MSNFENKVNQNHQPDLGNIIDESIQTFKKTIWISGLGILLLGLIALTATAIGIAKIFAITSLEHFVLASEELSKNFNYIAVNAGISLGIAILTAPLIAGFYKINHLAHTNQPFSFLNLFDYYKSQKAKSLFLNAILVGLYSNILGLGLLYLNLTFLATLIQLLIAFLFVLSVPLIIFENQSTVTAMSNSSKLTVKHPFTLIIAILFAGIIALLGLFAFCLGFFFTIGFIYTMIYTVYKSIIPISNKQDFEQIGEE